MNEHDRTGDPAFVIPYSEVVEILGELRAEYFKAALQRLVVADPPDALVYLLCDGCVLAGVPYRERYWEHGERTTQPSEWFIQERLQGRRPIVRADEQPLLRHQ